MNNIDYPLTNLLLLQPQLFVFYDLLIDNRVFDNKLFVGSGHLASF
jgi:hypothetical protein